MSTALWSVYQLDGSRVSEMRELFEQVFGHAMPEELWHWKYGKGQGIALAAYDGQGRMVGHYGGMPRPIIFDGTEYTAVQIGDVMVAQKARGVLTRSGPFAMMTSTFLDQYIGFNKKFLLGFGFPSERSLRVAQRHKLYAEVDSISELAWSLDPTLHLPWWTRLEPLDLSAPGVDNLLEHLWQQQRTASNAWIVSVRDAVRWRYRFAEHPCHLYQGWLLRERFTRRVLGALMLRPGVALGSPWELMDWIGVPERAMLLVHAARVLAAGRKVGLIGWFSSPIVALIGNTGCQVRDIGVRVPTSIRCPGPAPESIRGRWWLTGGDSDFR